MKWVVRVIKGLMLIFSFYIGIIIGSVMYIGTMRGWDVVKNRIMSIVVRLGYVIEPKGPKIVEDKEKKLIFVDEGVLVINYKGNRKKNMIYRLPSLSPDNKKIVFLENVSGRFGYECIEFEVWIMEIESGKKRRLLLCNTVLQNPIFLSDGRVRVLDGLSGNFILLDVDKNKRERMKGEGEKLSIPVDSSNDDKIICLIKKDTKNNHYLPGVSKYQVCVINRDRKDQKSLMEYYIRGDVSPRDQLFCPFCGYSFLDKKLIFLLKEPDGYNLYTVNSDGTEKKKITKMKDLPYLFCLRYPTVSYNN
jgi:hypothetical protein